MANPFIALDTVVYADGHTAVTWKLDPHFEDLGPFSYYLEVADTDTPVDSDYVRINPTTPVTDSYTFILDATIRRYSFDNKVVYRVVLETATDTYTSDPEKPNGNLPTNLLKVYREILRKEGLRLSPKLGGTDGVLYKRRNFGTKCSSEVIDKNTGQVIDYNSSSCFGTEYVGGYFDGVQYPLLYLSGESYSSEITQMGTQEPHSISARALVSPLPSSKDVWYETGTGRAFYIDKVAVTSKFSAKPLSLKIDMKMAAPTDVIYDFIDTVQASP